MATAELEARVHDEAGSAVIELTGDLDRDAEAALEAAYAQVGPATSIVLDFAGVDYINSTGIAVIVGLLARARTNGQKLSARGLTEHYRQIFEITRLSDFVTIHPDEATAVAETASV
jgi:anti-anti-sigma factor